VRRLLLAGLIVLVALGGCIRPKPKTGPQTAAPLDVPPAPPRVIALPEPEEPAESAAPAEPEPASKEKPRTRSRSPVPRPQPEAPKPPAETKPETPPADAAKPAATPPAAPLQPALQASTQEVQKQVEAQLAQAGNDLRKVDQRVLSSDGKTQYQAAQQFIAQARVALKEGNLVFAQKLAEKAVGLASNLVPR
jgi:hypothetical protein